MATFLWGGAVLLTLAGALLYWGAQVLAVESFYGAASLLLFLALILAGLSTL
jgi:hypothetical protein